MIPRILGQAIAANTIPGAFMAPDQRASGPIPGFVPATEHQRIAGELSMPADIESAGFSFAANNSILKLDGLNVLQIANMGHEISLSKISLNPNIQVKYFGIQEAAIDFTSAVQTTPAHLRTYVEITHHHKTYSFSIQLNSFRTPHSTTEQRPCFTFVREGQTLQGVRNGRNALVNQARVVHLHQVIDLNGLHPSDPRPFTFGSRTYHAQLDQQSFIDAYVQRGLTERELAFYRDRDHFFVEPTDIGFSWVRRAGAGKYWEMVTQRTEVNSQDRLRVADLPSLRVSRDRKVNVEYRASEQTHIPIVSRDHPDEISIDGTPCVQIFGTPNDPRIAFMRRPMNTQLNLWAIRGLESSRIDPGYAQFFPGTIIALNIGQEVSAQTATFFQVVQAPDDSLQFRLATEEELPDHLKGAAARVNSLAQADNADAASTQLLGGPQINPRVPQAFRPQDIRPDDDDNGATQVSSGTRTPTRNRRPQYPHNDERENDEQALVPTREKSNFFHTLGDLWAKFWEWVDQLMP